MSVEVNSCNKSNVVRVKSLIEVPKLEPFCSGFERLVTIMDLDGVLCESGEKNTTHANIAKLMALKRIATKSESIIFDSMRMRVDYRSRPQNGKVISFPFYNQDSENFLRYIVHRSNPNCGIDFKVDFFRKIEKGYVKEMEQLVRENLKQGRGVVFIGSNQNDISVAKKISRNIDESERDKIYIFNTGHWLI